MEDILIGVTDRTIPIFILDPASANGVGKTGLNAAAITVTYTRVETDNDVIHTDVTSSMNDLSALTDAHNDWGWKEVSATLSKGLYRLDVADAVFASGAWYAVVQVTITSGTAAATPKAFRLIARNDLTDISQTGDSYTKLPSDPADASDVAAGLAALNDVSQAEVNAEVVDALATDTYAEPTGTPGATLSISAKLSWLFMALRNGLTVTATKKQFMDDSGAAEWEKDLSDDGVTYTESEGNAP